MVEGTKSIVRTGNPTAVNTETQMTIYGNSTAASTPRVPDDVTHLREIRAAYGTDGAAVGASAGLVRISGLSKIPQDVVAGAIGGQLATTNNLVVPPSVYPVKVKVESGTDFTPTCYMQVTDTGDASVTVELLFGPDPGGVETVCISRFGQATAVTTPIALETLAGSSAAGSPSIPKGYGKLLAVHVAAASTSSATGESAATAEVSGGGVGGLAHAFAASNPAGTLATSNIDGMAAIAHEVGVPAVENQAAPITGTMAVSDVGAMTFGVTLTVGAGAFDSKVGSA